MNDIIHSYTNLQASSVSSDSIGDSFEKSVTILCEVLQTDLDKYVQQQAEKATLTANTVRLVAESNADIETEYNSIPKW